MVCFCDIPLLRTPQHRKRYGNYMIGLRKDCLQKSTNYMLSPVMYRYSGIVKPKEVDFINKQISILVNECNNKVQAYIKKNGVNNFTYTHEQLLKDKYINEEIGKKADETANLLYSYAFSKLYSTEKNEKSINNYDECEWRYIFPYSTDKDNNAEMWKLDIDKIKFEEDKTELNKQLWKKGNSRIIIPDKDICKSISFIVVRTDKQIEKMIKFIRNTKTIFGNRITQKEKDIIISKITSFESIETNY